MPGEAAFGTVLLMSDMVLTRTIDVVNVGADQIEFPGDWTAIFLDGVTFRITGSTGNDGTWTCDGDSTYSGISLRTTVTTVEDITDATTDGIVEYWPAVAQIVSVTGPALSLDTVDVTAHDSPDAWEEHAPTILRTGEVKLELNYDPAEVTHDATDGLPMVQEAKQLTGFELVFPIPAIGGTTWEFGAYVTGFEPGAPHEGKLSATASMKVTGEPTLV